MSRPPGSGAPNLRLVAYQVTHTPLKPSGTARPPSGKRASHRSP